MAGAVPAPRSTPIVRPTRPDSLSAGAQARPLVPSETAPAAARPARTHAPRSAPAPPLSAPARPETPSQGSPASADLRAQSPIALAARPRRPAQRVPRHGERSRAVRLTG